LKTTELTHQDIRQMDIYVRIYDDLKCGKDDNLTIGIILCAQKDASVVRYSVPSENEHLFATQYRLVLPTEEELLKELNRERHLLADE
jgi:YhcG PDDEXK nuclease domain